jgi:hypothetical protein
MANRKKTEIKETKFSRTPELVINGRTIAAGDIIKIHGEHGNRFKFSSLVTNMETGSQWIDCFEINKSVVSAWRSFKIDKIKLIPIKRGRRNVNRG